jgi:hypothetical protein
MQKEISIDTLKSYVIKEFVQNSIYKYIAALGKGPCASYDYMRIEYVFEKWEVNGKHATRVEKCGKQVNQENSVQLDAISMQVVTTMKMNEECWVQVEEGNTTCILKYSMKRIKHPLPPIIDDSCFDEVTSLCSIYASFPDERIIGYAIEYLKILLQYYNSTLEVEAGNTDDKEFYLSTSIAVAKYKKHIFSVSSPCTVKNMNSCCKYCQNVLSIKSEFAQMLILLQNAEIALMKCYDKNAKKYQLKPLNRLCRMPAATMKMADEKENIKAPIFA